MLAAVVAFWLAASQVTPPVPYLDWGACPFECCKYGTWTALKDIPVYSARDAGKRPVATLHNGEKVAVTTGVVITLKAGEVELLEEKTLGEGHAPRLTIPKGDRIYPLHYQGEGYELFWYRGTASSSFIGATKPGTLYDGFRVVSAPVDEWWVRVSTRDGRKGWVRMRGGLFGDNEGC